MTTGTWEPNSDKATLTADMLAPALEFSDADSFPNTAPEQVSALKAFVKSPHVIWQPVLTELPTEQLKPLCYFFTLAEARWSDWFGGDKNAVIWLCKELKERGEFPDKDLTVWIKAHSDNRFLPYGNLFG